MANTAKQFGIFLLGAIAGVTAGILMAPDKGKNTRDKLLRSSSDMKHRLEDEMDILKRNYNKSLDKNLESVKEGVDSMKKALSVK